MHITLPSVNIHKPIINAAERLQAHFGFRETTIHDTAQEAGIGKGTTNALGRPARFLPPWHLALILVLGVASGCDCDSPIIAAATPQAALVQGAGDDLRYPPLGKLVDIGGYKLHLKAAGEGKPVVVLIAGAGDFSFDWALVQPGVSHFAQACSYDRAGFAWSDLGPTPRTMRQEASELRLLLTKAGIKPPFVLVGHSVGGLIARVYAEHFPHEVAGIVLVDSTHEDTTLMHQSKLVRVRAAAKARPIPEVQTLRSSPPKPPTAEDREQAELNSRLFGAPKTEPPFDKLPAEIQTMRLWFRSHPKLSAATDDFWAEELQAMHEARAKAKCPLGDKPLVVLITSEKASGSPPHGVAVEDWKRLQDEKRKQKIGLTDLSRNSKLIVAEKSGHHIQLDEPELVVEAIRQVVESARQGTKLKALGTP